MSNFYVTLGLTSRYHSISEKDQLEFNSYSHFISSFYSSFLKSMAVKKLGRISIQLVESEKTIYIGKPSYGVSVVTRHFDVIPFFKESIEKNRLLILLKLLHQILSEELSETFKLEQSILQHAHNSVLDKNFLYEYELIKYDKTNEFGSLVVKAHQSVEKTGVFILVLDEDSTVKSSFSIMNLFPVEEYACELFNKCEIINSQVTLIDKSGEVRFVVDLEKQMVDIVFSPRRRSMEQIKDDLAIMTYGTSREEIEEIEQRFLKRLEP